MNVSQAEELALKLKLEGKAVVEEGKIVLNLAEMGVHKLLGRGSVSTPLKIIVPLASDEAKRKIEEAGGEIVLTIAEEQD